MSLFDQRSSLGWAGKALSIWSNISNVSNRWPSITLLLIDLSLSHVLFFFFVFLLVDLLILSFFLIHVFFIFVNKVVYLLIRNVISVLLQSWRLSRSSHIFHRRALFIRLILVFILIFLPWSSFIFFSLLLSSIQSFLDFLHSIAHCFILFYF